MPWGNRYRASDEERFEAKVDRSGDCHRWTGAHVVEGYGRFWYDGQSRPAHVAAVRLAGIEIPAGMTVDHVWARGCKFKDCVRVDHLEVVTYRENNIRSNGRAGVNARMTHCSKGHELSGDNLKIRSCGRRECKACKRENDRRRYYELRSTRGAAA